MTYDEWVAKDHIEWLDVRLVRGPGGLAGIRPQLYSYTSGRLMVNFELDDDGRDLSKTWMGVRVQFSVENPSEDEMYYDRVGDAEVVLRESAKVVRRVLKKFRREVERKQQIIEALSQAVE